jgi:hypothetical protein
MLSPLYVDKWKMFCSLLEIKLIYVYLLHGRCIISRCSCIKCDKTSKYQYVVKAERSDFYISNLTVAKNKSIMGCSLTV